jgi:hypothetical protein
MQEIIDDRNNRNWTVDVLRKDMAQFENNFESVQGKMCNIWYREAVRIRDNQSQNWSRDDRKHLGVAIACLDDESKWRMTNGDMTKGTSRLSADVIQNRVAMLKAAWFSLEKIVAQ